MSQVQCIKSGIWYSASDDKDVKGPAPQFMNIYTVIGDFSHGGNRFLIFAEFSKPNQRGGRDGWMENCFRPIEPLPPEEIKIVEYSK